MPLAHWTIFENFQYEKYALCDRHVGLNYGSLYNTRRQAGNLRALLGQKRPWSLGRFVENSRCRFSGSGGQEIGRIASALPDQPSPRSESTVSRTTPTPNRPYGVPVILAVSWNICICRRVTNSVVHEPARGTPGLES